MGGTAGYEEKNIVQSDLKGLYLQKGEVARLFLIEKEAAFEWVHRCILEGGKYRNFVCLGRDEVLIKEGEDSEKCPFCQKAAYDSPINTAARKFVTTVIRYRTDLKGTVVKPVMWEVLPWKFPEKTFNNLVAKKAEWKDLRVHDIKLTCEVQQYQNFNIEITPSATWQETKELAAAITEDYKKSKSPDVTRMLGRRLDTKEKAQEIVDRALAAPAQQDTTVPGAEVKAEVKVTPESGKEQAKKVEPAGGTVDFSKFLDV